jgi:hypothetical protein
MRSPFFMRRFAALAGYFPLLVLIHGSKTAFALAAAAFC